MGYVQILLSSIRFLSVSGPLHNMNISWSFCLNTVNKFKRWPGSHQAKFLLFGSVQILQKTMWTHSDYFTHSLSMFKMSKFNRKLENECKTNSHYVSVSFCLFLCLSVCLSVQLFPSRWMELFSCSGDMKRFFSLTSMVTIGLLLLIACIVKLTGNTRNSAFGNTKCCASRVCRESINRVICLVCC